MQLLLLLLLAQTRVIGPGQEPALRDMLALETPCTLADAAVEETFVWAKYDCADGKKELELHPRNDIEKAAAQTVKFDIGADAGTEALVKAVAARVTAKEGGFEWTTTKPAAVEPAAEKPKDDKRKPDGSAVLGPALAKLKGLDETKLAAILAEAKAAPDDQVMQLIAGMALAESAGWDDESKAAQLQLALTALEPLDDPNVEPLRSAALARVLLGLDRAQDARKVIDAVMGDDIPVLRAAAEVYEVVDKERAVEIIEKYKALLVSKDADPQHIANVERWQERVQSGEEAPAPVTTRSTKPPVPESSFDIRWSLLIGGLAVAGWFVMRKMRSS